MEGTERRRGRRGPLRGQMAIEVAEDCRGDMGQSRVQNIVQGDRGLKRGCSGSRRRGVEKVDKRMVLEYTHGLFIT